MNVIYGDAQPTWIFFLVYAILNTVIWVGMMIYICIATSCPDHGCMKEKSEPVPKKECKAKVASKFTTRSLLPPPKAKKTQVRGV